MENARPRRRLSTVSVLAGALLLALALLLVLRAGQRAPAGELLPLAIVVLVAGVLMLEALRGDRRFAQLPADRLSSQGTEKARIEAEESEARYRTIFENGLGFLCTHDLEGHLLTLNPAAAAALGYQPAELVGRPIRDMLIPSLRSSLWASYLESIRNSTRSEGLMRLLTRTGEERVWKFHNVLMTPRHSEPYVIGFALDVTESRRAQHGLAVSERRLRRFLDASGELIQSVNSDGTLGFVNRRWCETLGYTEEEAQGMRLDRFIAPSEMQHCMTMLSQLSEAETVVQTETVFLDRGGREIHVQGSISGAYEQGEFVGCLGFFRDMTQKRALEEQKRSFLDQIQKQNLELAVRRNEAVRANRLKSEFLATMSHELRTPLNAIIGFSELLAGETQPPLSEKQKYHLKFVQDAADHLLELINGVLDLSRIEAGRLKLNPEELLLGTVLIEVLDTIRPLSSKKQLRLLHGVTGQERLTADRAQLKQILMNLLSNAVKFTPAGGTVRIEAESTERGFLISVNNSGSHIAPGDSEAIFDEFQQARGSVGGTGLGLAIVRRLMEHHKGKVWVESSPETGTTFVLLFPNRPPSPSSALHPAHRIRRGQLGILVASDDPATRIGWVAALLSQRFEVKEADCGAAARIQASEVEPQVIVLDLASGPEKTGRAGAWRLLDELQQGSATKPLVLAVVPDLPALRSAHLAGAHGCLLAPVSDEILIKACRRRIEPHDSPGVVIIVDANPERQSLLTQAVISAGLRPVTVADGPSALQAASQVHPIAVILDLHLAELDAYQTIVRFRSHPETARVPALVLAREGFTTVDTQLLSGPTRMVWLPPHDWVDVLTLEIQRLGESIRADSGGPA